MAELEIIPENVIDQTNVVAEDAPAEEPEEISEESSTEETNDPQPQRKGVGKRIDELTAQRRSAERRAEKLERLLEQALAVRQQEAQPAPEPVKPVSAPTIDQFDTHEEWYRALARYEADQMRREWETSQKQAEAQRAKTEQQTAFQKRAEEFRLAHPDFDDVVFTDETPISEVMAEAIAISEKGPQVAYHLGLNRDEARRIFDLSLRNPVAAGLEIGRLEARLSLPQPRTTTKAPPPIQPLSAGGGTLSPDPDKMTTDEWLKWRRETLRK